MAENKYAEMRSLQLMGGCLLILRAIFSPDWMGLMNLLTLLAAVLLFTGRLSGKLFPMVLGGAAALAGIDALMGVFALLAGGPVLLLIRTALFLFFIIAFFLSFFGDKLSGRALLAAAALSCGADLLLSAAGGGMDMCVSGQTALTLALCLIAQAQRGGMGAGELLKKCGLLLAALGLGAAVCALLIKDSGAVAALYEVFAQSAEESRRLDLLHLLPEVNWGFTAAAADAVMGAVMLFKGRRMD